MDDFFNRLNQDRLLFYFIGILVLLAIIGYFLAAYSWNNVMNILTATDVPIPTFTPTPGA